MGKDKKKDNKKKDNKKKDKKNAKKKQLTSVGGKVPTYTKQENVQDFLDETEMKQHEKLGCVTFAAPGDMMIEEFISQIATEFSVDLDLVTKIVNGYISREHPKRAFKYVGGGSSEDQCKERVQEIMDEEPAFHIYITENGKWCTFDPSPDLIKDENYREEQLNEIIKSKKIGEHRSKEFFRSEMRKKVERARIEGTKEGQQILLEAEEPFEAVKFRAESTAKHIEEFKDKIADLERTRKLAEEKVAKMVSEGKDKDDTRKIVDEKMAKLAETMHFDEDKIQETKVKLSELNEIERSRVYPDNLSKATLEHEQKKAEVPVATASLPDDQSRIFESDAMIPSRDYPRNNA